MAVKMKRQSVTAELLEQDENVFVSQNSHQKGLQQYYSPQKLAEFMARCMNIREGSIIDLTAGCGSLLEPFVSENSTTRTFGIELDKGNIPKATDKMRIVNANLPELYPYLLKVEFQPTGMVLNPPFSLFWDSPELTGSEDKKIESQEATIRMGISLLATSGQGAFIVQKSSWDKSLSHVKAIADHVYATVIVQNAFAPYSAVECVVCFFTKQEVRYKDKRVDFPVVDMNEHDVDIKFALAQRDVFNWRQRYGLYPTTFEHEETIQENEKRFRAAYAEYKERKSKKSAYNIDFVSGRLKVHLSNYIQYILQNEYTYREKAILEKMHGLAPSYFAFNTQDRRDLFKMVKGKTLVTMSPAAMEEIEKAVIDAEFILAPMYALKPQQRLGYLENIDKIKCVRSFLYRKGSYGEAFEFKKNEEYDVSVMSQTFQAHYDKERGAAGTKTEMIKVGKALSIDIGGCNFTESADDINRIIDHFEVPDPMDVRAKKPALYDLIRARVESDEFKLFTLLPFQVEDLTRLAMKESCVLSWEQGLGKCLHKDDLVEVNGRLIKISSLPFKNEVSDGEGLWCTPERDLWVSSFDENTGKMVKRRAAKLYREKIDASLQEITLNDGSVIRKTFPHRLYNGLEWVADVKVGDFVAVPKIVTSGENVQHESVLVFLAWMIGEGCERWNSVEITQKDVSVLEGLMRLGTPCDFSRIVIPRGRCPKLIVGGKLFRDYLKALGYEFGHRSAGKKIPHYVMTASNANVFLRHYFEAEGCPTRYGVELTSASEFLIDQVRLLLRRYEVWAFKKRKVKWATNGKRIRRVYWQLNISGDAIVPFAEHVGFVSKRKTDRLNELVVKSHNTNVNVLPTLGVLKNCPIGKRRSGIDGNRYRRANASLVMAQEFVEKLRPFEEARGTVKQLEKLIHQDLFYAQVVKVRAFAYKDWVYDLEVEDTHTFVANGVVCHNTRGALAWSKLRRTKKALIVCPQDLKRQWIQEAKTLDIDLYEVQGPRDIRKVQRAKSGYFLIHYELLKGSRRQDVYVPEYQQPIQGEDGEEESWNALCPRCKAMRHDGWSGKSCSKCGFHVWLKRVKGMYAYFKHTFDTIIVDEGVKIKSKHSLQGKSVRSMHAKNRLLLSGSPIKGWISDSYWVLHWTLGNASPRFPYHYEGGTEKFLDDFGVFEYAAAEFRKSLSRGKKKLLPEIGNLHLLWKLFAPSIVRRLKVDSGVSLVNKNVHRIKVSFTVDQKANYDWWIANFQEWYKSSHVTDLDDDGIAMKEMILGLLWKLRLTATVPASRLLPGKASPGMEDSFFPGRKGKSNYTEKTLFVLTKVKEIVDRGEQVVVFSSLQDNMNFMHDVFARFGIRSEVANADTNPEKRGRMIADFKAGKYSVLVAGTQAVNLGHNIDNASSVIMMDYEWDHSTMRQAIDRVHRFTSKKDVNVYLLYTDGGIDQKQLFEIIDLKGQSSDLALDGKLLDQEEVQVDFFKIAREIMKAHKMGTEGLLDESAVERKIMELFHRNLALPIEPIMGGKPVESFLDAPPISRAVTRKRIVMIGQLPLGL